MCTFGLSGCRVKPPAALATKIQREDTQRDTKRKGEKKREILGPSTLPGPTLWGPHFSGFGGPTLRGRIFLGLGPALRGRKGVVLLCFFLILLFSFFFEKEGQKTETSILAKINLAKVGHPNFGQSRSNKVAKVGISRRDQVARIRNCSKFVSCQRGFRSDCDATIRPATDCGCHQLAQAVTM